MSPIGNSVRRVHGNAMGLRRDSSAVHSGRKRAAPIATTGCQGRGEREESETRAGVRKIAAKREERKIAERRTAQSARPRTASTAGTGMRRRHVKRGRAQPEPRYKHEAQRQHQRDSELPPHPCRACPVRCPRASTSFRKSLTREANQPVSRARRNTQWCVALRRGHVLKRVSLQWTRHCEPTAKRRAKQSREQHLDCFVALLLRNDESLGSIRAEPAV